MDPAFRDKQERSIASGLRGIFARQRRRLTAGESWAEFRAEFAALMERKLKETYEQAAMLAFLLLIAGSPAEARYADRELKWKADPYAKKRADWLAKQIEDRVKEEVDRLKKEREDEAKQTEKPPKPIKPTDLSTVIGPDNADNIAVTETTTADQAGLDDARSKVVKAGGIIVIIWVTEDDENVCPVCRPLHLQPEERWREKFPNGTPAHPRCRCKTWARTTWPDGTVTEEKVFPGMSVR